MKLHLLTSPMLPTFGINRVKKGELAESMYPPLGILYLAAYIRKFFPEVQIKATDGLLKGFPETQKEIQDFSADIIGISSFTGNFTGAVKLVRFIKKQQPNVLVILGGVHVSNLIADSLKRSQADFIAVGEGEDILKQIISKYHKFKNQKNSSLLTLSSQLNSIPGLAYLKNGRFHQNPLMPLIKNLDDIPFPARDLIDLKDYHGWSVAKFRPEVSLFSTRGCPYSCTFCSKGVWKLQKPFVRLRSPQNVVAEIKELINKFGIREYYDWADEINSSYEWAIALCQEKIKQKMTIPWKCYVRADKITPEIAHLLKKSGCWYVQMGIESGNQKTIDHLRKMITLEQVEKSCRLLQKEGIKICGLFMLYNAWEENGQLGFETSSDSLNTLKYANGLIKKGLVNNITWSHATPFPASCLYDVAQKYNLISKKYQNHWEYWNNTWSFDMDLPGISEKERQWVKIKGSFYQAYSMIRTGNLPLNSLPYLFTKGLSLVSRLPHLLQN